MLRHLTNILGSDMLALIGLWLEPAVHAATTTSLTSAALSRGHLATAMQLADRRCRLALAAGPVDHVLRAELLHRNGDHAAALADIRLALEIEPDDIFANRKLLVWGDPAERLAAAKILIELDREPPSLMAALAVLRHNGVTVVGRASVMDGAIRGWVAWIPSPASEPAASGHTILVEHGNTIDRVRLKPDPKHTLTAALGCANSFAVATSIAPGQWIGFHSGDGPLRLLPQFSGFTHGVEPKAAQPVVRRSPATPAVPNVTVVVPVYGDLAATRACFDSLVAAIAGERLAIAVIAVNDASPEAGMAEYLAGLPIDVITNPTNLGFVGAVNVALPRTGTSDVVLLNADTVLPAGAIGRLRAAARSAPDIGTVTPLSNNGELTSLPVPFRENPLPTASAIARIDASAQAAATGDGVVDIPTGIGFCLYVTRRCLEAVKGLSSIYERGYGEDVHLCLAAREAGLRSVCATGVYVGHAGTRSFRTEKRRLVMRNSARLAARFPRHEREVAAFVAADPLVPVRTAIGRAMMLGFAGRLLVAGERSEAAAAARAGVLSNDVPALLLVRDRRSARLTVFDRSGTRHASTFELPAEHEGFAALAARLAPDRIEVFDPAAAVELGLADPSAPLDLHLYDLADLQARTASPDKADTEAWQRLAAGAQSILAPHPMARAVAVTALELKAARITVNEQPMRPSVTPGEPGALGVVLLDEDAGTRRLLRTLGDRLPRGTGDRPTVVVLGATADDLHLIGAGGIMITGAVAPGDLAAVAPRYGITHSFAVSSGALFGTPVAQAVDALPMPLARFAWSKPVKPAVHDLWLSPDLDDEGVAAAIADWRARQGPSP